MWGKEPLESCFAPRLPHGQVGAQVASCSPRLSMTCFHYLGEFGEDQIYEAYRQGSENLEALLCGGTHGSCSQEIMAQREEL